MAITIRGTRALFLTWAVWAMMVVLAFGFIAVYGSRIPYLDEWELVPTLTHNRPLTLDWLWAQHNEHRIPLARLVLLALYWPTGFDLRAGMIFNVSVLAGLSGAMIRTAERLRGRASYADIFFPLAWLHWGHCYNVLMGWQVVFMIPVLILGTILLVIVRRGANLTPGSILLAGAGIAMLPLCGGLGLMFVPALSLWLGIGAMTLWSSGRQTGRRGAVLLLLFAAAAVLLAARYFVDFQTSPPSHATLRSRIQTSLEFLSTAFGVLERPLWWRLATIVVVALLVSAASLWLAWVREPAERLRILGLLLFLAGACSLALAIGWGRAGFGPMGLARRYVSLSALVPCACYFACLRYGRGPMARHVPEALCLVCLGMLWINTRDGLAYARQLSGTLKEFDADLKSGQPPFMLAGRYTRFPAGVYPNAANLESFLQMLHQAQMGIFRDGRGNPTLKRLRLGADDLREATGHGLIFKEPRHVYAIRLEYACQPFHGEETLRLTSMHGSGSAERESRDLPFRPGEDHALVWLDQTLTGFAVTSTAKFSRCEISAIELCVAP
jgi:hypothetical protein